MDKAADEVFQDRVGWPVDFYDEMWTAVHAAIGLGDMSLPGEDIDGRTPEYVVTHWERHEGCEKRHVLAMLDRIIADKTIPPITGADAVKPVVLFGIIMQAGNLLGFGRNNFEGVKNMTRLRTASIRH